MDPNKFGTLVEAQHSLKRRGFSMDFEVDEKGLYDTYSRKYFQPDEVTIVEHHRFEGPSAPDDMAVIYAIETNSGDKGILIDAYGTYSADHVGEFLKTVSIKQQGEM